MYTSPPDDKQDELPVVFNAITTEAASDSLVDESMPFIPMDILIVEPLYNDATMEAARDE